jgi:hypothetical protein
VQRIPILDDAVRRRIEAESGFAGASGNGLPAVTNSLTPVLPGPSADNMQFALRMAATVGEQDLALSYYIGRTDFPQPFSNHAKEVDGVRCDPAAPKSCVQGEIATDALLSYPRMQVLGFNASGEFNPFKRISESIHGIGYRAEVAVVFPQRTTLQITQDALTKLFQPAGEYDYQANGVPGGRPPAVIEATPFPKWTLGLDYTFGAHVYLNLQWAHGLVDEFGAGDFISAATGKPGWTTRASGVSTVAPLTNSLCVIPKDGTQCAKETVAYRIGDYLVLGADFKFLDDAGLLRIFTIWALDGTTDSQWDDNVGSHMVCTDTTGMSCMTGQPGCTCKMVTGSRTMVHHSFFSKEGFSAAIYPELDYNFGNGLELGAGALLLFGAPTTKFGDPAAGGHLLFTRGRYSF